MKIQNREEDKNFGWFEVRRILASGYGFFGRRRALTGPARLIAAPADFFAGDRLAPEAFFGSVPGVAGRGRTLDAAAAG